MIFPKIWSYPFDRKWKMIFFKKYMEKSYIVQIFWKDGLFKKMHWNMIFLVLSGKIVFFWLKDDLLSLDENWKTIFLKKYMKTWYYLYVRIGATSMILCLSPKRNQRLSSPAKMHLRAIDIQLTPTIPCTFIETLIGVFIYCFPAKKTQET